LAAIKVQSVAKREWITAGELMRQLDANPASEANQSVRDTRRAERAKRVASDEASIVADLQRVGVSVVSVYDFVGKSAAPLVAIPVLVHHLQIAHIPVIREGVIRALGLPSAREKAFEPLCVEFSKERDPTLRWAIVNALSGMARMDEVAHLSGMAEYSGLFD